MRWPGWNPVQCAHLLLCSLALAAVTCEAASFEIDFSDKATLDKVAIMGSAQFSYKHGRHPWRPNSLANSGDNYCPTSEVPRVPTGNNARCLWVGAFKCATVDDQLKEAFAVFDTDNSGLKFAQFKEVLMSRSGEAPLSDAEVNAVFEHVNTNNNDNIELLEFIAWWGCDTTCGGGNGVVKEDSTMTEFRSNTSSYADYTCLCQAQYGGTDCSISAQYGELCKTCALCSGRGTLETDIRGQSACYCHAGYSGDRCQCRGYGCWATGSIRLVDCEFNMYPDEITPAVGDDLQYQKNDWIKKERIGDSLINPDYTFITDYKRGTWETINFNQSNADHCNNKAGAAFYKDRQTVASGFETVFKFRLSNFSRTCKLHEPTSYSALEGSGTNPLCRIRGGDGFAFVLAGDYLEADPTTGFDSSRTGSSLGYEGMPNSVVVEFDTYYNPEKHDHYDNHISVQAHFPALGTGEALTESADHFHSLGVTSVSDMQDEQCFGDPIPDPVSKQQRLSCVHQHHTVKISHKPFLDYWVLEDANFMASRYLKDFLGQGNWAQDLGYLSVYFDDLSTPALVVPMNLQQGFQWFEGTPFVGFTASTGSRSWQTVDIMEWRFCEGANCDQLQSSIY